MSPHEESTCIGEAVKARRAARRELTDSLRMLKDVGGRLVDLGQRLESYQPGDGDVTKEAADGRLTFRKQGAIYCWLPDPLSPGAGHSGPRQHV